MDKNKTLIQSAYERKLIHLISLVAAIALMLIVFGAIFWRAINFHTTTTTDRLKKYQKNPQEEADYKKIIENSKADYKWFMEQNKNRISEQR